MAAPDLGNAHVIDWYLWHAIHSTPYSAWPQWHRHAIRFDPEDWTRYDGELL